MTDRLRLAAQALLNTEIGYEWDGTHGPEERAVNALRRALAEPAEEAGSKSSLTREDKEEIAMMVREARDIGFAAGVEAAAKVMEEERPLSVAKWKWDARVESIRALEPPASPPTREGGGNTLEWRHHADESQPRPDGGERPTGEARASQGRYPDLRGPDEKEYRPGAGVVHAGRVGPDRVLGDGRAARPAAADHRGRPADPVIDPPREKEGCQLCLGTGTVGSYEMTGVWIERPCPSCGGTGSARGTK